MVRPDGKNPGSEPYQSPTDMGVNMVGFAITDDDACARPPRWRSSAATSAAVDVRRTGVGDEQVDRLKLIMKKAGIDKNYSPARSAALPGAADGCARGRHGYARRLRGDR